MQNKIDAEHINSLIVGARFVKDENHPAVMAVLSLKNGTVVFGHAAEHDDPTNERTAYKRAFDQIWQLEGYLQNQRAYEASLAVDAGQDVS